MKKLILILLLILGFYLNFSPHINYDYPLHVDEWVHFTYSQHTSDGSPLYFGGESKIKNLRIVANFWVLRFLSYLI